jgi:hypothetical protein
MRDINTRGRKKDDSSFPLKGQPAALVATISLFPKQNPTTQLHALFFNIEEERRLREK